MMMFKKMHRTLRTATRVKYLGTASNMHKPFGLKIIQRNEIFFFF